MRLFLILFLASPALASPWLDGPARTAAKPECSCGSTCRCENGRIDPRCTCENCKCAIVSARPSRAQIEETSSHRPCEANPPKTQPAKKEGKESTVGNCPVCGDLCCCKDCKCTPTARKIDCCAVTTEQRNARIRELEKKLAARSVPATARPFDQAGQRSPSTTQAIPANAAARYSSYPAMGQYPAHTYTAAPVVYPSITSGGSG
jgi:hypothetical protein